ncbi:uncharacterized protein CHSO_0662 [Chryseobacterium sp. StRB126]|nr:uncharacterized protein CHSO_0662 [Chryseobacterium sp. StRB126]
MEHDTETGWIRIKNKEGKWGFINSDSIVQIPVQYDFLNPFENGLAYAEKGKEKFFITTRNLKLAANYDEVRIFSFGRAAVRIKNKWGFINEDGKIVIPLLYDDVDYFTQTGLCEVKKNHKSGFINMKGEVVVPIIYNNVRSEQMDNLVIAEKDKKWAFFDRKGKQLSDFIFDDVYRSWNEDFSKDVFKRGETTFFKNGAALVRNGKEYCFINEKLEPAFSNNKYDSASVFDTYKNAIIKRNGKYGIIKPDGSAKVPIEYDWIGYFDTNHNSSEYYNAKKGKIFHIYNKDLKKIGESYEQVSNDFSVSTPNLIFKNLKGQYGMVHWGGNIVIPFEYEDLQKQKSGFIYGRKNGKTGLLDENGKVKIPFQYKDLYELDDDTQLFIGDHKVIDIENKPILFGYDTLVPIHYNHQKFIASKNKKFGVVDIKNKVLLPLEYDEISNWVEYGPEKRHFVVKKGKHGLIEYETFKTIILPVYDQFIQRGGVIFACRNGKSGILDTNNKELCPFIFDEIKPAVSFGYGYSEKANSIYARKEGKFYEISLAGKVIKEISKKAYKENTEYQNV